MPNERKRGAQRQFIPEYLLSTFEKKKIISDNQDEVVASLGQRPYQIDFYLLKRVSCCDDLMERGFVTAEEDFVSVVDYHTLRAPVTAQTQSDITVSKESQEERTMASMRR